MPTGAEGFRRKQERRAAENAASGGGIKADFFELKDGQTAIVRFLEQGDQLYYADNHKIPHPNAQYGLDLICLDQQEDGTPCPACQSDNPKIRRRSLKGYINMIWRDGPVYERNEYGTPKKDNAGKKIVTGYADGVFLWKCSGEVFEMLLEIDGAYRGLMSRDFAIKRVGADKKTKYVITPAVIDGGPAEMTIADVELAKQKYNLAEITKPFDYAAAHAFMYGGVQQDGPQPTMDRSQLVTAGNVFNGDPPLRSSAFQRG
jgi:hypothetical protein